MAERGMPVRINVSGTIFETYEDLVGGILANAPRITSRSEHRTELFVDRNPKHFERILDYFRKNFTLPLDDDDREELRKEAEYFHLGDLAKMCSDNLHAGDKVRWKESVVEAYWNFLISYQFAKHENLPNLTCPDCNTILTGFGMNGSEYFVLSLHMKHHMLMARGEVTSSRENVPCAGAPSGGNPARINVGGTIFETRATSAVNRFMLDRRFQSINNPIRNQVEVFVNRSPAHFARILDFLQNRESFTLPWDDCARAELRKEAEYFNLHELVKICSDVFQKGDKVRWKENVVEAYWKFLLTYWFRKSGDRLRESCPDCNNIPLREFLHLNGSSFFLRSLHIKQHMSMSRGKISSVTGAFCVVDWGQWHPFVPQSVLRKVEEVKE